VVDIDNVESLRHTMSVIQQT